MQAKLQKLIAALASRESIVLAADCEVFYEGKAETVLARGHRLIIIKKDGTVLVHQPEGNHPINYMKAGTECTVLYDPPKAILNCMHIAFGDSMEVVLHEIYFVESSPLSDGAKIQLTGNERDMSDMLYENPYRIEKGLIPVSKEEQTKYGFIDVLCYDENNCLAAAAGIRSMAHLAALPSLRRYVEKMKQSKGIENVRGILVAPMITENAKHMLKDWNFSFVAMDPPKFREKLKKSQAKLSDF